MSGGLQWISGRRPRSPRRTWCGTCARTRGSRHVRPLPASFRPTLWGRVPTELGRRVTRWYRSIGLCRGYGPSVIWRRASSLHLQSKPKRQIGSESARAAPRQTPRRLHLPELAQLRLCVRLSTAYYVLLVLAVLCLGELPSHDMRASAAVGLGIVNPACRNARCGLAGANGAILSLAEHWLVILLGDLAHLPAPLHREWPTIKTTR